MDRNTPKTVVVRSVEDIAAAVRDQRARMRATRADLGRAAGLSRHFVAEVEHGKPSVTVDKLIVLLGIMRIRLEVRAQAPRLLDVDVEPAAPEKAPVRQRPAMPLSRMHDDPETVGCLECGARVRDVRRHLAGVHAMRMTEYRTKWGIPKEMDLRSEVARRREMDRMATRVAMQGMDG